MENESHPIFGFGDFKFKLLRKSEGYSTFPMNVVYYVRLIHPPDHNAFFGRDGPFNNNALHFKKCYFLF